MKCNKFIKILSVSAAVILSVLIVILSVFGCLSNSKNSNSSGSALKSVSSYSDDDNLQAYSTTGSDCYGDHTGADTSILAKYGYTDFYTFSYYVGSRCEGQSYYPIIPPSYMRNEGKIKIEGTALLIHPDYREPVVVTVTDVFCEYRSYKQWYVEFYGTDPYGILSTIRPVLHIECIETAFIDSVASFSQYVMTLYTGFALFLRIDLNSADNVENYSAYNDFIASMFISFGAHICYYGNLINDTAFNSGGGGSSGSDLEAYKVGYADGKSDGYDLGLNDGYSNGYDSGYEEGKNDGLSSGYEEGKNDGYNLGLDDGFDSGYESGYSDGETAGYSNGYKVGYSNGETAGYDVGYVDGASSGDGYDIGYNVGYSNGYNLGLTDSLKNPLAFFLEPVHEFLNINLFGSFSIGMAFNIVLFVAVACIFIKMFAGG